jgi:hypothetical protein
MQDTIIANREKLLSVLKMYAPYTYFHVLTDEDRYAGVSMDDPTRISYAEKPQDKFDYKRRRITTLGRYLNKLGLDVNHYKVASIISQLVPIEDRFVIRDDIYDTYNEEGMPHSCMLSEDCIHLYDAIPEVKILVLDDKARALLWNNKYIDRVYPDEPLVVEMYNKYAKANNMVMLDENSYAQSWDEEVSVEIPRHLVECYGMPYMDTIRHARCDGNSVILSTDRSGATCTCDNTGGEIYFCNCCDRIMVCECDYEVDGEDCCRDCYNDSNTCQSCDCSTRSELQEVGGMCVCDSCADGAEECDHCGELTFDELTCVGHDRCCQSCLESANFCECCAEHTFSDVTEVDGQMCCEDCADAISEEVEESVDA